MYDLLVLGNNPHSLQETVLRYEERGAKVKGVTVDEINRIDGLRFKKLILSDGTYVDKKVLNTLAYLEDICSKFA